MNCTKCGKELTEEGKTICDECQKKLLQEIKEEENVTAEEKTKKKKETKSKAKKEEKVDNKEEKKVEQKSEKKAESKKSKKSEDKKEDNQKEKKEEKTKKEKKTKENKEKIEESAEGKEEKFTVSKEKKKGSALKVLLIIIVLVALIAGGIFLLAKFDLIHLEKVGCTVGNIRNYGYAAYQGDKIYYVAPNADSTRIGIYSADITGDNVTEIFMNDEDIMSLNAYGNYLYFITIVESTDTSEEYDNKICRMKKDGSDFQVINDNEFNDYGYEIYVVKNKVYYIGEDSNIYKMNLDGSNRELVSDKGTGYIAITEDYIIYNDYIDENADETSYEYKTCIMNLDGTNQRAILGDSRLYTVNLYDDVIYYTNENLELYKVNVDGTNNTKVLDAEVYNLNVADGYIYYLGYRDIENGDNTICVYRANLDGSDHKTIKVLTTGTNFINVLNGSVLYMDTDLEGAYIKIMNENGEEEKNLYTLSLKDLYSQIEGTEIEEEIINDDTTDATNANEVASNEISTQINTNEVVANEVTVSNDIVTVNNTASASNTTIN